jgi:enhancing lycopene biosynthesis protein 2
MTKAFLLLSGCGNRDGSEIHEATLAYLSLEQHGVEVQCIAPDMPQARVVDHAHSRAESVPRNALTEAARIARGNILPLTSVLPTQADLLVMPGGLGAATTLSTFLDNKEHASVLPDVQGLIEGFYTAKKPIVAICIAPVLIALTFAHKKAITLTLGTSPDLLSFLTTCGMTAVPCTSDRFVADEENRVVSTPAYNERVTISTIWKGVDGAISAAMQMKS